MSEDRVNVSFGSEFEGSVGYSRAVRTGRHVVVAGTTGNGGTIAAQSREALHRIEIALGEVGVSMSDVVRTRMYVTPPNPFHYPAYPGSSHTQNFRTRLQPRTAACSEASTNTARHSAVFLDISARTRLGARTVHPMWSNSARGCTR